MTLMNELIKALKDAEGYIRYVAPSCIASDEAKEAIRAVADALEAAEKRIAELEAQMPKEGEWIEDDTTYCGADRANYKCSLCGKICGTWKRGLTQDELPNYCPNCGARMKGANDEH